MSASASKASAKGMKAYVKGKYSKAVDHFTEAIKHEPEEAIHYVTRSFAYGQQFESSSALKDAKKAVTMNPRGSSMAYSCLGNAYVGVKRYHAAVSAIKKGLKVDPNNIDLKFELAYAQANLIKDQQALESVEEEEDEESVMAAAASNASAKGMEAYVNANYNEAIGHFSEAIKHEPKEAIHYVTRSLTFCKQCEYYSALKDAKKTVNMNPKGSSMAYICLGEAYYGMEKYHAALSAAKKGLKVDPNNIDLKFDLAYAQSMFKNQQAVELDEVEEDSSDDSEDSEDSDSEDSDSEDSEDYEDDEEEQEENLDAATVKELLSKQNRTLELLESSPIKVVDDFSVKAALGVLNRMVDDEGLIAKGSELWCVATDLFADAAKRELFICMPDDDGRIAWLKHNSNKITKNKNMITGPGGALIEEKKALAVNVGGASEENKEEPKEESDEDDTGFCLVSDH